MLQEENTPTGRIGEGALAFNYQPSQTQKQPRKTLISAGAGKDRSDFGMGI
jgi:hypothetical protein